MRTSTLGEHFNLVLVGLLAALFFVRPVPHQEEIHDPEITGSVNLQYELACLARNGYEEARGESEIGEVLVMYVTMARASDNRSYFGGKTLCGVVHHKRVSEEGRITAEFSWTLEKGLSSEPTNAAAWQRSLRLAREVYAGGFRMEGGLEAVRFYINPKTASRRGLCWFKKNLLPVGVADNHHFYREPRTTREREALKQQPAPAECRQETRLAQR